MTRTIVALYDHLSLADQVVKELISFGLPQENIRVLIRAYQDLRRSPVENGDRQSSVGILSNGSIIASLLNLGFPEHRAQYLTERTQRGAALVAVLVPEPLSGDVWDLMYDFRASNIEERPAYPEQHWVWRANMQERVSEVH